MGESDPPSRESKDRSDQPELGDERQRRRKLSAIMMADVSGFSRMMGSDEDATVDFIKAFHRRVKTLVEQFEGRVVDTAGDSVFGEFDSVVNAVRCARRIQDDQAARNAESPPSERLEARIGVHLGDVIVEDYHVYGDGVNIAARLEPMADPGGICISEAVYQQIRNKLDLRFEDLGLRELKNIQHPVRVFKVASPTEGRGGVIRASDVTSSEGATAGLRAGRMPLWPDQLLTGGGLIVSAVGLCLLLSPIILFPTGGVLPTAGAIVLAAVFGRLWAQQAGREENFRIALGIAVASGAIWTNWSRVTNVLFLVAGIIVAGTGLWAHRKGKTEAVEKLKD